MREEERLAGLFTEHVTGPATEAAEPAQSSYGAPGCPQQQLITRRTLRLMDLRCLFVVHVDTRFG